MNCRAACFLCLYDPLIHSTLKKVLGKNRKDNYVTLVLQSVLFNFLGDFPKNEQNLVNYGFTVFFDTVKGKSCFLTQIFSVRIATVFLN